MTTIIIVNNNYYNYYKNKKYNYTYYNNLELKKLKINITNTNIFTLKYTDKWIIIKNNY